METEPGLCSVELWSTAKHTRPSLRMQTPYPTTTQSRPEGVADGHIVLLFPLLSLSIVLAKTAMANPFTNNSIVQADSISSSFSWFAAVVAAIFACILSGSSTCSAAAQYDILHRLLLSPSHFPKSVIMVTLQDKLTQCNPNREVWMQMLLRERWAYQLSMDFDTPVVSLNKYWPWIYSREQACWNV